MPKRWNRAFETRAAALVAALPEAVRGAPDAVHEARVASRRVREALALWTHSVDEVDTAKLMRRLRRVTRLLGRVRELDVGRELLEQLGDAHPQVAGEVQAATGQLAEARQRRVARLDRLGAKFQHKLERGVTGMLERPASSEVDWRPPMAAQIVGRRRRLLQAMESAGVAYAPGHLHAARIALKRFRYTVELAADLSGTSARRELSALKRAQQVLGRIHDVQVLATCLRKSDDNARPERTLALLEEESRRLHAQYLDLRDTLRKTAAECHRRFCLKALPRAPAARMWAIARATPARLPHWAPRRPHARRA